jgi:hypothetical protein
METCPVGVELVYSDRRPYGQTDGETDMKTLTVAFRDLSKAPKID